MLPSRTSPVHGPMFRLGSLGSLEKTDRRRVAPVDQIHVGAARETGAEVIVYGRYQRAGAQLWMNAYAIRPDLDEPQALARRTGTRDEMVSLCEDLADDVVRVLLASTDHSQLPVRSRRGTRSLQVACAHTNLLRIRAPTCGLESQGNQRPSGGVRLNPSEIRGS